VIQRRIDADERIHRGNQRDEVIERARLRRPVQHARMAVRDWRERDDGVVGVVE